MVDGDGALRIGEVDKARAAYRAIAVEDAERAAVGLISVALAVDDHQALRVQLAKVDPERAGVALLVAASWAALRIDLAPSKAQALRGRICAATADERLGREAKQVCAHLLARSQAKRRNRCVAGCDTSTRLPLSFVSGIPVVMVAVGEAQAVPFIVDTGASGALITAEHARRAGVTPVVGSELEVGAAGGQFVQTSLANLTMRLGDVRIEGVEAVVLDLPIEGIGGIVSPQTTLADLRVTLDFSSFALTLEPGSGRADQTLASWPWLLHERRPVVLAEVGERPARPLLLDTGAQGSSITERLDALGDPLSRKGETKGHGAGGSTSPSWTTEAEVPVRAGEVSWLAQSPTIARRRALDTFPAIEVDGTLGMDFFMGRQLRLSSRERGLWISREAKLTPWKVGDGVRYQVEIGGSKPAFALEERVVERDGALVTIEVKLQHPKAPQRFRFRMQDGWNARGSWLVTRKALALWDVEAQGLAERPPAELPKRYAPAFVSFKTQGAPMIRGRRMQKGTESLLCTELAVRAEASGAAAAFRMIECPAEPWRVVLLELTAGDGATLWRARRTDLVASVD